MALFQHVYGVTITCSSWFHIKRDIVTSSYRSSWTPGIVVVGRSTPGFVVLTQKFYESAIGAFSVSAIVCLSWTTHLVVYGVTILGSHRLHILGVSCSAEKGERFNELFLDRVLGMDRATSNVDLTSCWIIWLMTPRFHVFETSRS